MSSYFALYRKCIALKTEVDVMVILDKLSYFAFLSAMEPNTFSCDVYLNMSVVIREAAWPYHELIMMTLRLTHH